jgi:hypothetical protein
MLDAPQLTVIRHWFDCVIGFHLFQHPQAHAAKQKLPICHALPQEHRSYRIHRRNEAANKMDNKAPRTDGSQVPNVWSTFQAKPSQAKRRLQTLIQRFNRVGSALFIGINLKYDSNALAT